MGVFSCQPFSASDLGDTVLALCLPSISLMPYNAVKSSESTENGVKLA